jgi:hypothetical protein
VLLVLARRDVTVENEQTLDAFAQVSKAPVTSVFVDCHHGMQFEAPQLLAHHIYDWLPALREVRRLGKSNQLCV